MSIRVFDLRNREEEEGGYISTVNLFVAAEQSDDSKTVDLLAYRHHMRWLKLCDDTLDTDKKTWRADFQDYFREFKVTGWKEKLENCPDSDADMITVLNKCRFCQMCVKTAVSPDRFYGDGPSNVSWNQWKCTKDEPYMCGMQNVEVRYRLLNASWRIPGPVCPLSTNYLEAVEEEFSLLAVQNVAMLGNRIARDSGDLRLAARRVQEIMMRQMEPQVRSTIALLANQQRVRDQIVQIHTTGALPHLSGEPPDEPRTRGLPYDPTKTVDMAKKIWKDVREGRVLVATSHVAGGVDPVISTPTAMVQKRLRDRTLSDDYRIISDPRFTSLNCVKTDFFEVKLVDIRRAAEKALATKLRWPRVTVLCNKRTSMRRSNE